MGLLLSTVVATIVTLFQPYAKDHGVTLSVEQTKCLAEAAYYESRGDGIEGNASIAYVVLNRAAIDHETICHVVHKPGQFSYYAQVHLKGITEKDAWIKAINVAILAQLGEIHNPVADATMYNNQKMPRWKKDAALTSKVGHQYFYTRKDAPRGILAEVNQNAQLDAVNCLWTERPSPKHHTAHPDKNVSLLVNRNDMLDSEKTESRGMESSPPSYCGHVVIYTKTRPHVIPIARVTSAVHNTGSNRHRERPRRSGIPARHLDHKRYIPLPTTRHYRRMG